MSSLVSDRSQKNETQNKLIEILTSTVRDLLLKRIPVAYIDPQFQSLVFKPLLIQPLMDLDVVNLSDAQLQRLELCLRLGKPADIYLIDEPSAYLNEEEISVAAKVIKNFILYAKKTAFVVETDPDMGFEINDKVILFSGKPASDIIATKSLFYGIGTDR
ncbi:ABC transporter E family member [Trifolium repens]|nr:ABC transporter E family member [Trifolium repens]